MSTTTSQSKRTSPKRPKKRGGKFLPALCNIVGSLILLAVIVSSLPLALPRFLGYQSYAVVSGSMEPEIPTGSVVYTQTVDPRDVDPGDVIAFNNNGSVVTHRVVQNQYFREEIITKGDANEKEDINPVAYADVLGRVRYHLPVVGRYLMIFSQPIAKVYLLVLAACGLMFNILAGRMRNRQNERFQAALERYDRVQEARLKATLEEVKKNASIRDED